MAPHAPHPWQVGTKLWSECPVALLRTLSSLVERMAICAFGGQEMLQALQECADSGAATVQRLCYVEQYTVYFFG